MPNQRAMVSLPKEKKITGAADGGRNTAPDPVPVPKRAPQALFDRSGMIRAWDPTFLSVFKGAADIFGATIFDLVPEVDPDQWAAIWTKIASESAILLRLGKDSGTFSDSATGLVIHRCLTTANDLAVVTIENKDGEIERQSLNSLQQDVLEAVARGWGLRQVTDLICRRAEELAPEAICSVLTVDAEGRVHPLAGPSLPEQYSRALEGLPIGPVAGSCGTAAFRGEPVIVTDIATDPLWADYKDLPLPLGLRACWSSPIRGRNGKVTGTFAFYYRTPRGPNRLDREIVEICLHLCAIAIEHEETQSRIRRLALCDPLTGLPNRAHFQQRASDLMKVLPISERSLAILYIDLDEFKGVNDTMGHWAGDQLLKSVAHRFQASCRLGEMVARLGGDEFAVLQFPVRDITEISDLAARLLSCFAEPFDIEDRKITIGASIGIAQAPNNGSSFMELLQRADVALYHAKRSGGGTYHFFTEAMDRDLLAMRSLEDELRNAIAAGEIMLYFQPIVDLRTRQVHGFEALARWMHPKHGMIPPAKFIELAEHAGIIGALGNFILTEACRHAGQWPADLKLAVNLAPSQLIRPSFALDTVAILASSGLAAHRLEVEITEAVRLAENAAMRKALTDLKTLGVSIVLDDFGTGSSALGYLRSFPFDKVKIDLAFVRDLADNAPAKAIIEALIVLAANLGMATTAEGVESAWQQDWLQAKKCTEAQGFLFARPMPAKDVFDFLESFSANPELRRTDACSAEANGPPSALIVKG